MKRFFQLLIIIAFTNLQLYSKSIDEATAKSIATTFFSSISGTAQLKNGESVELIYKATAPVDQFLKSSSGSEAVQTIYFYIFSSSKTDNFVIVSGDDKAKPILGYSTTSSFDPGNIPPNMKIWLDGYISEIQYAIDNDVKADQDITKQWINLSQRVKTCSKAIVAPLIETHWGQESYYNDLCPYNNTLNARTITGCGATAMAQIMKYWNYPTHGIGSNSYTPKSRPELGIQSADFGNTKYDWASMPNQISAPNHEIARLMFHCGVSVEMDYGTSSQGGSESASFDYNHPSVFLALKNHFGYKHTCSFIVKSSYSGSTWLNTIKAELDAHRPVFYTGHDNEKKVGHAFVCDGYDNNNYLHFNWGWGGLNDGYFTIEALNTVNGNFNNDQKAIIGIEPLTTNPCIDIQMNSKANISPSNYLTPGQPFSVEADIKNFGALSYNEIFAAAVIDANKNTVGFINFSSTYTLVSGASTGTLSFSTTGLSGMTQGTYNVIFLSRRSSDKVFELVKSSLNVNGYYTSYIRVVVSNNNAIAADNYENNDTESTAPEITPVFVNDVSENKITDINIHNKSDVDFFKIKLQKGYNYTVTSFLLDCSAGSDGNFYTLEGGYSYKIGNDSWSSLEDCINQKITYVGDDSYLIFKVSPLLEGYIGTYALKFTITREEKEITPTQGLVAYYPFNGNADDESGNGNNGTIYGASLTEDRFGNSNSAFWFNGISDYIKVPDAASLDMTSKMSITGWLKKDKNVPWANMLTKGGEFGIENNYSLQISENNGMIFTTDNQSTKSSKSLSLNEWHFVTFTWDGDTAKIYIDGIADSSSFTLLSNAFVPNNSSLYIGVDKPFSDEYLSGYLDDIKIFSREINREEVAILYNETFTRIADNKKKSNQQLKVFPNPTTNFVTITFNNPDNKSYDLYISNIIGERVLCIESVTANRIKLDNLNLQKGIYLLEMKGQNTQKGKMIIIK